MIGILLVANDKSSEPEKSCSPYFVRADGKVDDQLFDWYCFFGSKKLLRTNRKMHGYVVLRYIFKRYGNNVKQT